MQIPIIQDITSAIHRRNHRRVAIRQLMALDDRTLNDIGLHRGQIHSVVENILNPKFPSGIQHTELSKSQRIVSALRADECLHCAA